MNRLDKQIRRIVYLVGTLTIPARLNSWLSNARPGYYIPFHLVFKDELPVLEDRDNLLNLLAYSPVTVKNGIIDTVSGVIYRYSSDKKSRLISLLMLGLAFVLLTGVIIVACYLKLPGWPFQTENLSQLLVGWGAVLVGMIFHVGVGSIKRIQSRGGLPPVIAVGDLSLIINARIGQMLSKLLLAAISLFGLAFASGVDFITPLNAFLLGYSLDNFAELFGTSVEQQASAQMVALKQQLGVADGR